MIPGADKVLARVLPLVEGLDIEEEDVETFEEVIRRHFEVTDLRVESVPGHCRLVSALTCPFYASKDFSQHAALLDDLQMQGLRVMGASLVSETGRLVVRVPDGASAALGSLSAADQMWQRWAKALPWARAMVQNSRLPLAEIDQPQITAAVVAGQWLEALEPALNFALRGLPPRDRARVVKQVNDAVRPDVVAWAEEAIPQMTRAALDGLDRELLNTALQSKAPTLGLYNYLTAPCENAEQTPRYRAQALQAMPNFAAVFADYHRADPLSQTLRDAVDTGQSVVGTASSLTGAKASVIKAFNKADLSVLGGEAVNADLFWIANYCRLMEQFPPQRAPTTAEQVAMASNLNIYARDLAAIAERLGQTPMALWDGLLKRGWREGLTELAAHVRENVPEDPGELAALAGEGIREICDMLQVYSARFERLTGSARANDYVRALFGDRSLLRLAEPLHHWGNTRAAMAVVEVPPPEGLPKGHQWSKLLQKNPITLNGVTITELVNEQQLSAESDVMNHCVGGYGSRCKTSGYRIFRLERGEGSIERNHRGTLSLIISSNGTELHEEMLKGHRNCAIGPTIRAAGDQLIAGIRDGTLAADLEGAQRDRLRTNTVARAVEMERRAQIERDRLLDEFSRQVMPKACRGMTPAEFVQSPYAAEQLRLIHRAREQARPLESAFGDPVAAG